MIIEKKGSSKTDEAHQDVENGLDDAETVGNIVGVATRGRVELPGDPAIVWLGILGPGITTELFINCKTLWPRGGKLQSNIGDVIGLV